MFLAIVEGGFPRRIVGWYIDKRMKKLGNKSYD